MSERKTLSLSVLVTREEYIRSSARERRSARRHAPVITGVGALLGAAGLAGLFFGGRIGLAPAAAVCIVALGLFFIGYDGIFAPVIDRGAAAREYDEKEELRMATTFVFTDKTVRIQNGRVKGELPLSLITRWTCIADQVSFSFGSQLSFVIPARLLDAEQTAFLKESLSRGGRK